MVLKVNLFSKYRILVLFVLIISFLLSCNRKESQLLFVPEVSYGELNYKLSPIPINQEFLGGAVTKLLIDKEGFNISSPFRSITVDNLPVHPVAGPFLFTNGEIDAIVSKEDNDIDQWIESLPVNESRALIYIELLGWEGESRLSLSKDVRHIENTVLKNQIGKSTNGKFKLTPWNMAAALSQFSNWEGIHLDTLKGELIFIGSDRKEIPQISASDLIAAYNSIFVHESAGEALFVDMDFAGNDRDYLVTFGGGFEDTRPGRVLLTADLLLKALSSGIDPWNRASPLLKDWCNGSNTSRFQKIFCNYVRDFALTNAKWTEITINKAEKAILDRSESTFKVVSVASVNTDEGGECLNTLLTSNKNLQGRIISEIRATGKMRLAPIIYTKDGIKYTQNRGCNFSGFGNREDIVSWVKSFFSLSSYERSVVKYSKIFPNENHRILYSLLSLGSPDVKRFLDIQSRRPGERISQTFNLLFQIAPQLTDLFDALSDPFNLSPDPDIISDALENASLRTALAFIYFMTENEEFARAFFSLNEVDQLTLAYISINALTDQKFATMINNLQYYQPLCQNVGKIQNVRNGQDAFFRFTCNYLSENNQIYLADLIREQIEGYKTGREMQEKGDINLGNEVHTTRYWFYPANEVVHLSLDLNTFLFNRPNMEARAERLDTRRGPYEAIEYYEKERIPGIHDNLDFVNEHYEAFSEVFPTLKELNNLVKMLAFFRWIYYYHPDKFDLEAFNSAVDYGTPTERIYPIHETVIALPSGGWLTSKGGVDLHSKTQVKINQPKIDRLLGGISSRKPDGGFQVDDQLYQLSQPIVMTNEEEFDEDKTLRTDGQRIQIKMKNGLPQFTLIDHDKLSYSLRSTIDVFGDEYSIQYDYQNDKRFKEAWSIKEGLSESWTIENHSNDSIIFQRIDAKDLDMDRKYIEIIKEKFSELIHLNLPFEELWGLISEDFADVKLTKRDGRYFYSFKHDGSENTLLAERRGGNQFSFRFCTSAEREALLREETLKGKGLITLQLQSIVPTERLTINELGMKNDELIRVEVHSESIDTFQYHDWFTSSIIPSDYNLDLGNVNVLAPIMFEKIKGDFQTYELTNRPFLVESVASLRKRYRDKPQEFVLCRSLIEGVISEDEFPRVWGKPDRRLFIIDPKGFSQSYLNRLRLLADNVKAVVLGDYNLSEFGTQVDEVIWVSTLSESEIARRLEEDLAKKFVNSVKRLRVLNVNNPVYDLGTNLFVDHPSLEVVGAYPLILDFETVYPVLQDLLNQNSRQQKREFDEQVADAIQKLKRDNRNKPTPLKLRVNRYLDDFNSSWEEINPFIFSTKGVKWTKQ